MSKATPVDDQQRVAKVKADIRALDAAIDTAFFGANPSSAGPSSPSRSAGDHISRVRSASLANSSGGGGETSSTTGVLSGVVGGRKSGRKKSRGQSDDFDGPDDIPLRRKTSPPSFSSTPLHYDAVPDSSNPRYENPYETEEPVTLARRLFFYGFLFFPFWIAGFCIIFAKPRQGEWVATDATPAEQERLIVALRQTELKWAKRCGFALVTLVIVVVAIVLSVQLTTHRSSDNPVEMGLRRWGLGLF